VPASGGGAGVAAPWPDAGATVGGGSDAHAPSATIAANTRPARQTAVRGDPGVSWLIIDSCCLLGSSAGAAVAQANTPSNATLRVC